MDASAASSDHADVRVLPPVLYLGSILVGVALGWLVPFGFATGGRLRVLVGIDLVIAGLALIAWAFVFHRRTSQDPDPRTPSPELIGGGPYRFTRNPMYVGDVLILLAVAVFFSSPLGLAGVALFVAWMHFLQIPAEERAMKARFGEAYDAYCARVRRWI